MYVRVQINTTLPSTYANVKLGNQIKNSYNIAMNKLTKKEWINILGLVVVWRLFLQFVSFLARNRLIVSPDYAYEFDDSNPWLNNLPEWLHAFANWDSGWYLKIAQDGYQYLSGEASNVVFFPLYPLLIRVLTWILHNQELLAGLIISHLAISVTAIFLYKLVRIDYSSKIAWRSVAYLLLFPASFFFASVYTESLFIMLAVLSFYFARRERWLAACLMGLLLGLTKAWGAAIVVPLFFEYLQQKHYSLKYVQTNIFYLLIVPTGTFLYMLFLKIKFGSFMLFASTQGVWHGETAFNLTAVIEDYWHNMFTSISDNLLYQTAIFFDFAFLIISLALAVLIFLRVRKSYGIYALIATLIPVTSGIMVSMSRYVLIIFPIYILMARWGKYKLLHISLVMFMTGLLTFLFTLFIHGYWVA